MIHHRKLDKIKNLRLHLLKQLSQLSTAQFNKTPENYSNNIIWNLGHMISVQQNLCYVKANLPIIINEKLFASYLPGTKPQDIVNENGITEIKELLITTIDIMDTSIRKNNFNNYTAPVAIQKVYGFEINTIEDAIDYLLYHDGYHAGLITSIIKHL